MDVYRCRPFPSDHPLSIRLIWGQGQNPSLTYPSSKVYDLLCQWPILGSGFQAFAVGSEGCSCRKDCSCSINIITEPSGLGSQNSVLPYQMISKPKFSERMPPASIMMLSQDWKTSLQSLNPKLSLCTSVPECHLSSPVRLWGPWGQSPGPTEASA